MSIKDWFAETGLHSTERKARASIAQAKIQLSNPLTQTSVDGVKAAITAVTQALAETLKCSEEIYRFLTSQQAKVNTPAAAQVVAQAQQVVGVARQQGAIAGQIAVSLDFSQPTLVYQHLQQIITLVNDAPTLLDQAMAAIAAMQTLVQQMEQQQAQSRALVQQQQQYLAQFGGVDPAEILRHVQAGTYVSAPCGILLHKNEVALLAVPARLAEDRTTTRYVGGSSGVSVPVGYGMRFRVGSYRGHGIAQEHLTVLDAGTFIVTTQRIVFNGARQNVNIPAGKVLSTTIYKDGVSIQSETRRKREVFLCGNPQMANTYVLVASQLATA
ncbi:MAG: hypothetical protein ABI068_02980 [Ktedonobacterales bacterium]